MSMQPPSPDNPYGPPQAPQPGQFNSGPPPRPAIPGQPQPTYPAQPPVPQYQPPAPANDKGKNKDKKGAFDLPALPTQTTPYDFFLKSQPRSKLPKLPVPNKASLTVKIAFVAGVLLLVLIGFSVVSALLPKDTAVPDYTAIAQTQQEIIRVCGQGAARGTQRSTRYYATTCSASLRSDEQAMLAYLAQNGVKVSSKQLGLLANAQTDAKLKSAIASSNFDPVFLQLSQQSLQAYANRLKARLAMPSTKPKARVILQAALTHDNLLLEQVGTAQSSPED